MLNPQDNGKPQKGIWNNLKPREVPTISNEWRGCIIPNLYKSSECILNAQDGQICLSAGEGNSHKPVMQEYDYILDSWFFI
jgi:hypothetical protein